MSSPVQELIAKKNYAKAVDVMRADLARRPHDDRLQLQLADVLIMAGRNKEAVSTLLGLADQHGADGFQAKAIAVLKRIEKIEPGRQDVEDRLAHLIQKKVSQAPSAPARPAPSAAPVFGLEEFDPSAEISIGSPAAEPPPVPEPAAALEVAPPPPVSVAEPAADLEGLDYVEVEAEPQPTSATQQARSFLQTPLFEGFDEDELAAIIRGLQFLSFAPGDILVAEGAPGDSLFIIVSGTVKAYVRDRKGHYMLVKELADGDFFGEISVLTGKPRTATITAATECEVLELDKKTLDGITKTRPRVREVMLQYQKQRAQDTVEQIIKGKS
jgi:hypothetical protein